MAPTANLHAMGSPSMNSFVHGTLLRVALSVIIPVVWLSLTLIFVAFFAPTFSAFQDFVVVVVSVLALIGAIVAMWVGYGMRLYHRWADW